MTFETQKTQQQPTKHRPQVTRTPWWPIWCVYGHVTFVNHLFSNTSTYTAHSTAANEKVFLLLSLTFDGDDMLPDLVLQQRLLHALQQLIDGVNVGVHRLEALDLGADGGRVGQVLLVVHGYQQPDGVRLPLLVIRWRLRDAEGESCDLQEAERSRWWRTLNLSSLS